jgi:hypothetical protein
VPITQQHFRQYHQDIDVSDALTSWKLGCGVSEEDWFPLFEFCEAPVEIPDESTTHRVARKRRMYALCKFCPGAKCCARSWKDIQTHADHVHPEMVRVRTTEVKSESKAKSDCKEAQSHNATSDSDSD